MKFEHFGINVPDAPAMATWYVEHLHMQIVRAIQGAPHTHFLADATGRVVVEIYSNPIAPIPDYANQDPLCLHIAFAVDDAAQQVAMLGPFHGGRDDEAALRPSQDD